MKMNTHLSSTIEWSKALTKWYDDSFALLAATETEVLQITTDHVRASLSNSRLNESSQSEEKTSDDFVVPVDEAEVSKSHSDFVYSAYCWTAVIADPIADAILHAKPIYAGRTAVAVRIENPEADALEAQTGVHVFRKAKNALKRNIAADESSGSSGYSCAFCFVHPRLSGVPVEAPKKDQKRSSKLLTFSYEDEE